MIETTVPEINVAELMERVRADAARPKPSRRPPAPGAEGPALPPVAKLPAAPSVWIPGALKSTREKLERLVETAREKNDAGSRLPKFLRRFFRKQGGYNRAVVDGMALLARNNQELTQRVAEISTCLGQLNSWLQALHEQSDADANWMNAAAPAFSEISTLKTELGQVASSLASAGEGMEELWRAQANDAQRIEAVESAASERIDGVEAATRERIGAVEASTNQRIDSVESSTHEKMAALRQGLEAIQQETVANVAIIQALEKRQAEVEARATVFRGDLDRAGLHLRSLQAEADGLSRQLGDLKGECTSFGELSDSKHEHLQGDVDRASVHLRNLQTQADNLGIHINNLQGFVDKHAAASDAIHRGMEQRLDDQVGLAQRITAFEERTMADAALVKGELSEYGALFRRILGERWGEPAGDAPKVSANGKGKMKAAPGVDSFYVAFENRFRGPRSVIKKRVEFYLPFLRKCRAGTSGRPVLDVGCGRGEWLELLKEQKLEARGVDMSAAMISQCKGRSLKCDQGDALEHLQSLHANTLGAVTGFHIIEHLPFETLLELFRQTRRVLKPGGVAIFESPNCKNLIVGACNFHIDPTHQHPVFPETAELMLASHGFEKIRIEYLSPVPDVKFAANTPELATIRDLFYGPQDFGIIAYKPAAR